MNYRTIAEEIFLAGVRGVLPGKLIGKLISVDDNYLRIGDNSFSIEETGNIYVIGAGKASALMATEVEKILGERIAGGCLIVKDGFSTKLKYIKVTEAGHPVPDSRGFKATSEILKLIQHLTAGDLIICLLSGGGSALLTDVPGGCSSEEMIKANDLLVKSGATISEMNAVRKHLSGIKGGQLARLVYPARLISLILSDVPGNRLDVIASGPTVPDSTTFSEALSVLSRYGLAESFPESLIKILEQGMAGLRPETPKSGDIVFEKTHNVLAGSNDMALACARSKAMELNINALIIDNKFQGDVLSFAGYLVGTAIQFRNNNDEVKPVCLLFGGETTVKVTGKGKGGRNQHLALLTAQLLRSKPGITVLSAGTDGNDGPTDAAGAVVDSETISEALSKNINPENYLSEFDSYDFFKKVSGHVITGPTMTNVMDIIVVIVE